MRDRDGLTLDHHAGRASACVVDSRRRSAQQVFVGPGSSSEVGGSRSRAGDEDSDPVESSSHNHESHKPVAPEGLDELAGTVGKAGWADVDEAVDDHKQIDSWLSWHLGDTCDIRGYSVRTGSIAYRKPGIGEARVDDHSCGSPEPSPHWPGELQGSRSGSWAARVPPAFCRGAKHH